MLSMNHILHKEQKELSLMASILIQLPVKCMSHEYKLHRPVQAIHVVSTLTVLLPISMIHQQDFLLRLQHLLQRETHLSITSICASDRRDHHHTLQQDKGLNHAYLIKLTDMVFQKYFCLCVKPFTQGFWVCNTQGINITDYWVKEILVDYTKGK